MGRSWGDGATKTRKHEIAAMSYEMGVIACDTDGEVVHFGAKPADVAWNEHRGALGDFTLEQQVISRAAVANDDEVSEFLAWVAREDGEDRLPPTVGRSVAYAADHATGSMDSGIEFLALIREMQDRCTCDTTSVFECPNYADGDEETDDGGE